MAVGIMDGKNKVGRPYRDSGLTTLQTEAKLYSASYYARDRTKWNKKIK